MPTQFDTKLKSARRNLDNLSMRKLDALQTAFKRLGRTSQLEHLGDLRDCGSHEPKLKDLADLLENVLKPSSSRPRRRPSPSTSRPTY